MVSEHPQIKQELFTSESESGEGQGQPPGKQQMNGIQKASAVISTSTEFLSRLRQHTKQKTLQEPDFKFLISKVFSFNIKAIFSIMLNTYSYTKCFLEL